MSVCVRNAQLVYYAEYGFGEDRTVRADSDYAKKRQQMKFRIPYSEIVNPETLKLNLRKAGIEYTRKDEAYYVTEENGKRLQVEFIKRRPIIRVKVTEMG